MHPTSGLLGHAGRKEQRDLGLYLIHRIGVSGRFIIKTAVCCCVQSLCPKLRQHDMQVLVHLAVRLERKGTTFFRFIQKAWWHRSTTTLLYSAPSSLSTRYEQQHIPMLFFPVAPAGRNYNFPPYSRPALFPTVGTAAMQSNPAVLERVNSDHRQDDIRTRFRRFGHTRGTGTRPSYSCGCYCFCSKVRQPDRLLLVLWTASFRSSDNKPSILQRT